MAAADSTPIASAAQSSGATPISLSYVVPVYNEAAILDATLRLFVNDLEALSEVVQDFEVIVVDDGSTDESAAIAEAWCARDSRVRYARHTRNQGVGAAILTGLRRATKDWFAVNCADRPFDTRDVSTLAPLFESSEVIVVSRLDRRANSWYRKLTSHVNYRLIKLLFGIPVSDCQFVQFYRTAWIRDLPVASRGTLVPPELILRTWRAGARISEVRLPFHGRPGGAAKYGRPRYVFQTLYEMARLRVRIRREHTESCPPGVGLTRVTK